MPYLTMFPYYSYYEEIERLILDIVARFGDDQRFGQRGESGINYVFINTVRPKMRLRNKDPTDGMRL